MANVSASAAKAAESARDFTKYADKEPSDLQKRFAEWILEVTGYEPDDMDAFNEGVRLATALRMAFQASPENQEVLNARREAAEAKRTAVKEPKPKKAKTPKKVEPEAEADEDDDEDEAAETVVKRKPGKRVKRPAAEPEAEVEADEDSDSEAEPF